MAITMRERILNAASALFFRKGFSQVKINEIADYMGISKKTIYNHFNSKQSLMDEASQQWLEDFLDDLDQKAASSEEFQVKLKEIIGTTAQCLSGTEKLRENSPPAIINALLPPVKQKIINITKNLLEEGMSKGHFRQDVPGEVLPYLYLGIIESYIRMLGNREITLPPESLMEITEKVLLEGILTTEGRREFR